jgi:molecular chaperone GrpE
MTKHSKHPTHQASDEPAVRETGPAAAKPGEAAAPTAAVGAIPEPASTEIVAALEAEKAELKDRVLRTLADMENLRRRCERDVADARTYAISRFAGDMLGVADNMGRALAALPQDARDGQDPALKALVEGTELVEREMLRALEKHGVKRIDPKGEKFDPHFHQAMFELPDPSVPAGTIAQVVQVGYTIGDRVLRPALVGVARGGPKAAAAGNGAEAGATIDKSA